MQRFIGTSNDTNISAANVITGRKMMCQHLNVSFIKDVLFVHNYYVRNLHLLICCRAFLLLFFILLSYCNRKEARPHWLRN